MTNRNRCEIDVIFRRSFDLFKCMYAKKIYINRQIQGKEGDNTNNYETI